MSLDASGMDPGNTNNINDFLGEDLFPSRVEPILVTVRSLPLPTTWKDVFIVFCLMGDKFDSYAQKAHSRTEGAYANSKEDFSYRAKFCSEFANDIREARKFIASVHIEPYPMFSARNVTLDATSGKIISECTFEFDISAVADSYLCLVNELTDKYKLPNRRKTTPSFAISLFYSTGEMEGFCRSFEDSVIDPAQDFLPILLDPRKRQIPW